MFQRAFLATIPVALLTVLLAAPVQATQEKRDQEQSEERDGPSRNEIGRLSYIPLVTEDGKQRIQQIVIFQTHSIYEIVTDGTPDGFGVEFENLNKVDTSSVPLIGSLFGPSISADDFTEENRVGAVYTAGDNTLAVVVNDDVEVGGLNVSVVNGDGRFQLLIEPQIIDVTPDDLGDFGKLDIVREFMTRTATADNTFVLAGITETEVPEVQNKVPWLADIPTIQGMFRGGAYETEKSGLLLLLKPTILLGHDY